MNTRAIHLLTASALGVLAAAIPNAALAQNTQASGGANGAPASDARHDFHIPAGRLSQSALALSEQAGVQVVFDSATIGDANGNAVEGGLTAAQALDQLLAGTPLRWRWLRAGVVTIEAAGATDGERLAGTVRVEGVQGSPYFGGAGQAAGVNGVNGSRDITATEGTKSFTSGALTIGSKAPQAIKDVPQSISVLTSERLEQQAVTDYNGALKQLPGISFAQGGTNLETSFYSRGFEIKSIQVDGGAPLITNTSGFFPQIDLSVYDHIELLRGAATFNGYGDPGGTINLVRKKPLDHAQYTIEGQVGSWQDYRVVADATAPLAFDGKLRGRLVTTYEDRHYFYDLAKDDKTLIYGIAELDATPTTLLTAGVSYTRQNSLPWVGGLPRYQTGAALNVPRSTALAFPWNRWDFRTTEIFGEARQKLGGEWVATLNVTYNRQTSTRKVGFSTGSVNPLTNAGPTFNGSYSDYASKQLSTEATVAGAFTIFGQRQEVTVGASRVASDFGGQKSYQSLVTEPYQPYPGGPSYFFGSPNGEFVPINVFAFNPYDLLYTQPRDPLPNATYSVNQATQWVAYANVRLTAFDRLHLQTGLRWTRYDSHVAFDNLCTSIPTAANPFPPGCVGKQIGYPFSSNDQRYGKGDFSWPPSVSLSYDVTPSITGHVGYTDIYVDQSSVLDTSLNPLPPITGSNIEAGVKWAPHGGRLNVALALYRIRQKGFATPVSFSQNQLRPGFTCCYASDPNATDRNDGAEIEVTGALTRAWQVAASYAYNRTRQDGSSFGSTEGAPFRSIQPEHNYKLWTSYDFGAAGATGPLSRLTLSGGVNGQSSAYQSGFACVNLAPPNALGVSSCRSFGPPDSIPYSFTVPAYAVVSGRIDYRLSKRWALALNVENILDKTYYQSVGAQVTQGNWYGTPRSARLTVSGKW